MNGFFERPVWISEQKTAGALLTRLENKLKTLGHVATTSAFGALLWFFLHCVTIFSNNIDIKYSMCFHTLGRILSH